MVKELMARGQATIATLSDANTIVLSPSEYIFPATSAGAIPFDITITCKVAVSQGSTLITSFTIGEIERPDGFSAITVDSATKTITFIVSAGTTTLAEHGKVLVPITIAGVTYSPAFVWSRVKAGADGEQGRPGVDANLLDWVEDWNNNKTLIGSDRLITPKLFTGIRTTSGTISGTAMGRFVILTRNNAGQFQSEEVNGIYGFSDGYKTFSIDTSGSIMFGRGNESIRYDALSGKISFGPSVAMQWAGATFIDKDGVFTGTLSAASVSALHIDASQIATGKIGAQFIDVASLKASLLTAGNIEALTLNVTRGKIGGWSIDADSIFRGSKNNTTGAFTQSSGSVALGSNGLRGYKWRLDATGAGALAGGNISWDAAGNVSFADTVSVVWQKGIDTAQELASSMAFGKMLYRDPTFRNGQNSVRLYNILANGNVTLSRIGNPQAPNDSGQVIEIVTSAEASPGLGGFSFSTLSGSGKIFVTRIIARIPAGITLSLASNATGKGAKGLWLTANIGTGKWEEYIYKVVCGLEGPFSTTNFFYLSPQSEVIYPIVWQVAYATVFDITACEKYTTTIDSEGIYTGAISAAQITTGTLSAERIAAGSIRAEKLDAASIKASIINSDYIEGLNCTFVRGRIGGWEIGADNISAGSIGTVGATPIQIRSASNGSGSWFNGMYRPYGIALTWYRDGNAGHLVLGDIAASGGTVRAGFVGLQMMSWDSQEYFCLAADAQKSGGKDLYCRIAGWAFDHQHIWKNNISLGSDGSITNGTKWKLNNDGSGQVAAGSISWDASGRVTFASSVAMNWTAPIDSITTALGGTSYNKLTKITSEGIYTGMLTASQVNAVAIDAGSIRVGTISSDRIAAGSIDAAKLDAESIKSSIINTEYINGLSCHFKRGIIGGWSITAEQLDSLLIGECSALGEIRLRSFFSYSSSSWFDGYPSVGLSILWTNVNTSGHLTFGEIANMDGTPKEGYMGVQLMDWDGNEYFCLSAPSDYNGEVDPYNRIAGWAFDQDHIWKNNISLGSDGSITNGTKWGLNNDGSGRIAAGNIAWDAAGNVSFAADVSVAWTAGIDALTGALGGSTFPKLTQITATGIYTGTISAAQINVDTDLIVGGSSLNGSISVRDDRNIIKVTLDRQGITAVGGRIGGWILNSEAICAAAPLSGHRIYLTSSGYMYNDNPNTAKDYWGLKPDGSATFGYGTTSFAADGSGFLAGGNLSWDAKGNLIGRDATLEDIFMTGTFRSPFVAYDGSIIVGGGSSEAEMHDNLTMPGGGGWILGSDFPWDATQNGRTVMIVNYKYKGTITSGKMSLSAPTGKYFFEDGILKDEIILSREYVLLKGYGEGSNFYGWIVMHRGDIGTVSKYGSCAKVMYQGFVENGIITRYKSFDGGKLTCIKTATGIYRVSFPTGVSIPVRDYTVMATGANVVSEKNYQLYASLTSKTTTDFIIKTSDDSSLINGSFTFQVISMADWS